MEPKKISFGFNKLTKKSSVIPTKATQKQETNKVELIKCLEGQEIKLVEEKPIEAPLVIPLKESQKTSAALASLMKRRAVLLGEDEQIDNSVIIESAKQADVVKATDSIEQRAAKELLADLKSQSAELYSSDLVLPIVHPDDLPLEGAKESSLDDYGDVPIEQFGKAMLRGMGWVEPPKPLKGTVPPLDDAPMVRPKGMGLGADKALKAQPLLVAPESNEILQIKRNAFVRILGGKHKDLYGQIEGFDDHAGRVIVKMAIGGFKEAFNEFLCQPISKKEYAQYGKCINSTKYEEYKRKENEYGQIILKKEELADIDKKSIKYERIKKERSSDDDCKVVEKNIKADDRERKYNDRNYKSEYKREDERANGRNYYKQDESKVKKEIVKDKIDETYSREQNYRDRDNRRNEDSYGRSCNRERLTESYEKDARYSKPYDDRDHHRARDLKERKNHHYSDESEGDDGSQHKKYHKDKKQKKKSKKSKKSKSKYHQDSESSSSNASDASDAEDERRKKHKKKTKKSKRERERSRSRGRR